MARPVIMWIPPRGGLWCIQVAIGHPRHDKVFISRRNIDVGEPLEPLTPHARTFLVGNPFNARGDDHAGADSALPGLGAGAFAGRAAERAAGARRG